MKNFSKYVVRTYWYIRDVRRTQQAQEHCVVEVLADPTLTQKTSNTLISIWKNRLYE